ncbi:MAG: patatin-like phospholipase family protein [Cetobacterium sp.]|uniref:patatin-like phospholipase family protein n=1 Tax=Cetobacterium sp. TaxID=2071632 RepID=UPI003F32310C
MFRYLFPFLFLISTTILLGKDLSPEDKEIEKLQQQIKLLQQKIVTLENKKIDRIKKQKKAPSVALVLSGGGAKGFAHIGVLKALEKNHIKIDSITGSSMGAIVAALYSAGYTPDQIEKILSNINWEKSFEDNPNREDMPLEQKALSKDYGLSLRYDGDFNFSLPKSLRNSQRAYLYLKKLLWNVDSIHDFNKLPIPLRIVATNLDTGKATTFDHGDLAKAVTASMAIPTIFDPVKIGNHYYVDGLVSRNFPVQDAVNLGADVIIGVDVGTTVKPKSDYNIISTMDQILAIQSAHSTPEQRKLTTILITPDVGKYKSTDLSEYKAITKEGEIAADRKMKEILQFPIQTTKSEKVETISKSITINNIIINNKNNNHKYIIKSVFENYLHKPITLSTLQNLILKLYSFSFIDKVYYVLDKNTLHLDIQEAPSNIVGIGFNYQTNYGTTFSIGTDINRAGKYGSISTIEGTFGDYLGLELNNFFYYGVSNKIGILFDLKYYESPFLLYDKKKKISQFKNDTYMTKIGLLTQYNNMFLLSYGISMSYSKLNQEIGRKSTEDLCYSKSYGNVFLNLTWDKTNTNVYPTSGTKGNIQYNWGGNLGQDNLNFSTPAYLMEGYFPITDNLSINSSIFGASINGDDVLADKYIKLGGSKTNINERTFAFDGYYFQQKLLKSLMGTSFGIQYEILDNLFLFGKWNIATFDEPKVNYDFYDNNKIWKNYHQGYGIGIGYSSIIGPVEFSLSKTNSGDEVLAQFSIGYSFD